MTITTVSSREFNQDISKAKRDALKGPVFITDRGHPAHVLLSIEEYQKISDKEKTIADLLAMPDAADIDFEPPKSGKELHRPADFS
jgi:prevent-host-death family protein